MRRGRLVYEGKSPRDAAKAIINNMIERGLIPPREQLEQQEAVPIKNSEFASDLAEQITSHIPVDRNSLYDGYGKKKAR